MAGYIDFHFFGKLYSLLFWCKIYCIVIILLISNWSQEFFPPQVSYCFQFTLHHSPLGFSFLSLNYRGAFFDNFL